MPINCATFFSPQKKRKVRKRKTKTPILHIFLAWIKKFHEITLSKWFINSHIAFLHFFYLLLLRFEFFKENMNFTSGFLIYKWCLWNATYTILLPIRGIYIHEFTYILIIILYLNLNILNSLKLTILSFSSIIQLTNAICSSHYDNMFINELMGDLFPLSSTKNIQYLYHNFTTRSSHLLLISFPLILQVKRKLMKN